MSGARPGPCGDRRRRDHRGGVRGHRVYSRIYDLARADGQTGTASRLLPLLVGRAYRGGILGGPERTHAAPGGTGQCRLSGGPPADITAVGAGAGYVGTPGTCSCFPCAGWGFEECAD